MKTLQIHSIHSLNGNGHNLYEGITTNNIYFYCTLPNRKEIHRLDLNFENCKAYVVCRSYSAICYDACDECFWALSPKMNSTIYQLDCDFNEIDCIDVSFPCQQLIRLVGVACGPAANELTVNTSYFLGTVNKKRKTIMPLDTEVIPHTQYLCVEIFHCDYLYAACTKGQSHITLATPRKDVLLHCYLDTNYTALDLTVQYLPHNTCDHLYVLVRDTCNSIYVLKCILSSCEQKCQFSCSQSCSDIIESIALVEASIAHILNAKGEMLQKAIMDSDNICEMLKISDSIHTTLKNITELEKVLLKKLRIAEEICVDSP